MTMTHTRWVAVPLAVALLSLPACLVWTTAGTKVVPIQMSSAAIDSAHTEIIKMMERSAQSWNRGDLNAFVADYDSVMAATFVQKNGVVRGRPAIREIYAPRFAPGGKRDSLSFENIEVDLLAPDAANVIAFYRLMRGDSTTSRGPTSLVMRKRNGAWKISHDHSS
jgi:uncharacterized protein (TIGR02246 family)